MVLSHDLYRSTILDSHPDWERPIASHIPEIEPPKKSLRVLLGLNIEMYRFYCHAAHFTSLMEQNLSFEEPRVARYDIHYGFLSFPKLDEIPNPQYHDIMLCICRTAGLLFNDMVLYPLPYCSGRKILLASQLRDALHALTGDHCPRIDRFNDLLLWASVLGAIAATLLRPQRKFFLENLRSLSQPRWDWPTFKSILSSFLWYGPVCDPPAQKVWEDLQGNIP